MILTKQEKEVLRILIKSQHPMMAYEIYKKRGEGLCYFERISTMEAILESLAGLGLAEMVAGTGYWVATPYASMRLLAIEATLAREKTDAYEP